MGGEKATMQKKTKGAIGSPPRGRGKVRAGELGHRASGITPAWAGKRIAPPSVDKVFGDHPRVGGEKVGNNSQFGPG